MKTELKRYINKYGVLILISYILSSFPVSPFIDQFIGELNIHNSGLVWLYSIIIPMIFNLIITTFILIDLRKEKLNNIWVIISTIIYPILGVIMFLIITFNKKDNEQPAPNNGYIT